MKKSDNHEYFVLDLVTGSRADAGILGYFYNQLLKEKNLILRLIATGTHTTGTSYRNQPIDEFGAIPDFFVPIPRPGNNLTDMGYSMTAALKGFLDYFKNSNSDAIIILGDRYESYAAAQAACFCQIPIIHLHGGEITKGSLDNFFRDAISKLASLHLVAADVFKKRLVQLGIASKYVFVTGALGLDRISDFNNNNTIVRPLKDDYILATFHPVSLLPDLGIAERNALLESLEDLPLKIVFSKSFGEPLSDAFNETIKRFIHQRKEKDLILEGKCPQEYLHYMKHALLVIGNSSSGLIEAPFFKIPIINVGVRQNDRLSSKHTLHVKAEKSSISNAIAKSLTSQWRARVLKDVNPYGNGDAIKKIVPTIQKWLNQNRR
jgi:GDP/UDP-N,N'-diacetylbacillosamine 2-epimerase (hydrolysing)